MFGNSSSLLDNKYYNRLLIHRLQVNALKVLNKENKEENKKENKENKEDFLNSLYDYLANASNTELTYITNFILTDFKKQYNKCNKQVLLQSVNWLNNDNVLLLPTYSAILNVKINKIEIYDQLLNQFKVNIDESSVFVNVYGNTNFYNDKWRINKNDKYAMAETTSIFFIFKYFGIKKYKY